MISDIIEFGQWLNNHNQDDFGKTVEDDDYIISISFDKKLQKFYFIEITSVSEYNPHFFKKSIFSDNYYIETNQMVMIANNNSLLGITPFFIKIDHDFGGKTADKKINKFFGKVKRAKNYNNKNKEFVEYLKYIIDNLEYYWANIEITKNKKDELLSFFDECNFGHVQSVIEQYYEWIYDNKEEIVERIIQFKSSEKYENKEANFYLSCYFNSKIDLLNDVYYFYSKFIKKRNKQFEEIDDAQCSFCDSLGNVYPVLGSYAIGDSSAAAFSFNYDKNKKTAIKNSRLKFCKKCAAYSMIAENKLMKVFRNNIIIIPKKNGGEFGEFLKIANDENISSFKKINKFLGKTEGFSYDLMIYKNKSQGKGYIISRYIENYKAFLIKFEKINLYNGGLNYLFHESFQKGKKERNKIRTAFDLEYLFRQFFVDVENNEIKYPNFSHFYEIYLETFRPDSKKRTRGLFSKKFDTHTVSVFAKYMENVFNLIYELNEDALNKTILNDIVLNCLVKLQKNNRINEKNPKGILFYQILRRLNYYFMLKKELWGDDTLAEENVAEIRGILKKYNIQSQIDKITLEDSDRIVAIVEKDHALKYYLIGQFLGLIDSSKQREGKKKEVFANFVTNVNRNNIMNLFVTEVLQKNNYYIAKMNKKGKFIFKLFEKDINSLFNEKDGFGFEDYLILIFTGYYTENILSSNYGVIKNEGDKNE